MRTKAKRLFAENTNVDVLQSIQDIDKIVTRYGATRFMYARDGESLVVVRFEVENRHVKFVLPLPSKEESAISRSGNHRHNQNAIDKAHAREVKRRYRALLLAIKAKFEIVESGIATFEEEFLAHIVLPDGSTVAEVISEPIKQMYLTGKMPKLLGSGE